MNLDGQRFGRLTVIGLDRRVRRGVCQGYKYFYKCKCDCGNFSIVERPSLLYGRTQSCGCIFLERSAKLNHRHGGYNSRLYRIWQCMKTRCQYPNCRAHRWYGALGIKVCDAWQEFAAFRDWALANGYRDDLTIDRIDNTKGYEPGNCRWADMKTQYKNRRPYGTVSLPVKKNRCHATRTKR